jgi:hypothetical protein
MGRSLLDIIIDPPKRKHCRDLNSDPFALAGGADGCRGDSGGPLYIDSPE